MSGPMGIGYTIESAEQREARERAAALVRWREAARRREAVRARSQAHGLAEVADAGQPADHVTARAITAATAALDAETAHLEAALDGAIREHEAAALRASVAAIARAVRAAETAQTNEPTEISQPTEITPTAETPTAEAPSDRTARIEARLQRILARQVVVDRSLAARAEEILRSSPARASLLLDDLSHTVDTRNAEIERERARAREAADAATRAASEDAARESDRSFVLGAVVASLRDLGYTAAPTTVEAGAVVVRGAGPRGYGVLARVEADEIALRSVRLDPALDGAADLDADEHLGAALPALAAGLERRGVRPGRVRSVPAGSVAAPVIVVPAAAERTEERRHRQPGRAREA